MATIIQALQHFYLDALCQSSNPYDGSWCEEIYSYHGNVLRLII